MFVSWPGRRGLSSGSNAQEHRSWPCLHAPRPARPHCNGSSGDTDNTPSTTDNNTTSNDAITAPTTTTETGGNVCGAGSRPGGVGGVMRASSARPAPPTTSSVTILGEGGVCLTDILELYDLPCGYRSKLCELPPNTAYVPDDAIRGEGVTCIGADMYFEGCVVECTDNADCPREGYECRIYADHRPAAMDPASSA